FHDGEGRQPVAFPWERLTGAPLIYASMGTVQNGMEDVFRKILAAVERPGYQVVLSIGTNLAPETFPAKHADTIIVQRAPPVRAAEACIPVRDPRRSEYHARGARSGRSAGGHSNHQRSAWRCGAHSAKRHRVICAAVAVNGGKSVRAGGSGPCQPVIPQEST